MRPSILLCSAFALGSVASPLVKRLWVTNYVVVTVTQVVTQGQEMATTVVAPTTANAGSSVTTTRSNGRYRSWGARRSSTSVTATASSVRVSSSTYAATTVTRTSVVRTSTVVPAPTSVTSTRAPATSSQRATSSSAAPAAPPPPTSYGADYEGIVLRHHDVHRANNSANGLTWNSTLASIAATTAAKCVYAHDTATGGGGYGQNIAAGAPSSEIAAIISDWFHNGEVNAYWNGVAKMNNGGQPDMSTFHIWGHYSQIVWKGTRSVACATHYCGQGGLSGVGANVSPYFTVCNYYPPGNYANQYAAQVGSPLNHPTVTGNDD